MIYSLRWQLLLSMVAVILVTVGVTAFFASRAATAEIEKLQGRDDIIRTRRLNAMLVRLYRRDPEWSGAQRIVEQAGELYGQRVVLANLDGLVVADSHNLYVGRTLDDAVARRSGIPVFSHRAGGRLGTLLIDPNLPLSAEGSVILAEDPSGPSLGLMLALSGLLAMGVALALTFFLSRRILAPVESLSRVSRLVARRDFSARADVKLRDEVGDLARTFNSMVEELSRTEVLRRNLVADVAHELRTPVTNILGYIEGISDGVIPANDETLASMHSEMLLLTRLIEDLQDLALAESGQMQLRVEPCRVGDLVRGAIQAIQPQAHDKQISLLLEETPDLSLQVDPQRIGQVLRNLLVNAVNYTPAGGEIRVSARQSAREAQVSIKNTGAGIPAEDLPHVFERFYRVDKSRSRTTGGVGLGLTIGRHLVEAHGGRIEAFSEEGNTEFLVTLPRWTCHG